MSAKRKLSASLLYFGRITGLVPFRVGEDQSDLQLSIISVVYATVLVVSYSTVFFMALHSRFTLNLPIETPLIVISDGISIVVEYFLCIAIWLTFAYSQEHISRMLQDFSKIQEIAWEYFEIPIDYETIICHITVYGTWINVIYFIRYIIGTIAFDLYGGFSISVWLFFDLPHLLQHNVILVFLLPMNAIGRKFRHLNEKLIQQGRSKSSSRSINDFAYVHGFLCDFAESINDFFSHLLLLMITQYFASIVTKIYTICMFLKSQGYTYMTLAIACISGFDITVSILEEYFLGSIVEATVKEARNTGNALHEMANKQRPLRQRTQVYAFSIQLLRRRLDLSVHGFFKLDLSLMHNTISTATTYVIIMMQLENFNPNTLSN